MHADFSMLPSLRPWPVPELVALFVLCFWFLGMPCVMVSFPTWRFGWLVRGGTSVKTQLDVSAKFMGNSMFWCVGIHKIFHRLVPNFVPQTRCRMPSEEEQSESIRLFGGALFLAVSTGTFYAHGPTASSLAPVSLPASFYSMAVGDDIVFILWF